MIPFCTKLDAFILNGYVEADHDQVGFDGDITSVGGHIPIVVMFTQGFIVGAYVIFLLRKRNEWFYLYLA